MKTEFQVDRERARTLCRMTAELVDGLSPPERDRIMQIHLAQARGQRANAVLLCRMTDALLRASGDEFQTGANHGG